MSRSSDNGSSTNGSAGGRIVEKMVADRRSSLAVVELLASLEGVQPHETSFQLNDYVDGEALDRLLSSANSAVEVSFTIEEYRVTVDSDGNVTCQPS